MQREDTCSSDVPSALWARAAPSQRDHLLHAATRVARLLRATRGVPRLFFVGDSVQWSSLRAVRCWLEIGGCRRAAISDPHYSKRYDVVRERWNCSTGPLLIDFSYRGRWPEAAQAVREHAQQTVDGHGIRPATTIVVFGVGGAHYHKEWKGQYAHDMSEFAGWVSYWVNNGTRPRFAIVRDPSPQHFPYSEDGTFQGTKALNKVSNATQCCARADPKPDWRSITFDQTIGTSLEGEHSVRILRSYTQADALWFGHPADSALLHTIIGRAGAVDCTHYCLAANHLLNAGLIETLLTASKLLQHRHVSEL